MEGKNKTELRRRLRYRSTKPELLIWQKIRNRQLNNSKFRRQHSIGPFVVDFYCPEKSLVLEIDGDSHATKRGREIDVERTAYIESQGYKIIRYHNKDVLENLEGIFDDLLNKLILT